MDDGCRGMAPAIVSGGADGPEGRPYVRKWRLVVCGCWFLDDWTTDDGCGEWRRRVFRAGRTGLKAVPTSGNGGCWFVVVGSWTNDDWTIDDVCRGMASAIKPSTRPLPGWGGDQGEG